MAMGPVLTVLSNLPWGTIVESAPKVAENASRLWESVRKRGAGRKAPADETQSPLATAAAPDDATAMADLQRQLNELRSVVGHLEDELRASADVIRDLADQNARLIERVERARRRLKRVLILGSVWLALLTAATLSFWLR